MGCIQNKWIEFKDEQIELAMAFTVHDYLVEQNDNKAQIYLKMSRTRL